MNSRMTELLEEIKQREDELEDIIDSYEKQILYKIEGTKIRFDELVENAHRELKIGLLQWFLDSEFRNIISAPFIYTMIIPFLLIDILISIYQVVCFSLYKIPLVKRSQYIIIDRHHLKYLNMIEKLNCMYCGYVNGLISYTREIVARTEQYWCPIKHARKILDSHSRYKKYINFGDSEEYQKHVNDMRDSLFNED